MFKKENLIKLLIAVVILLILGAISIPLALDPNMGLVKKKEENSIIMMNENSNENVEIIEQVDENSETIENE